jgi:hypothetical protein
MRSLVPLAVTLPYCQFYRKNARLPVRELANRLMLQKSGNDTARQVKKKLRKWMVLKIEEFKVVQVGVSQDVQDAKPEYSPFSSLNLPLTLPKPLLLSLTMLPMP